MRQPQLPMFRWRPLHPLDNTAVRRLLDEATLFDGGTPPREWHILLAELNTTALVGPGGQIAAYALLSQSVDGNFEFHGRVHPDFRRRGLGRYLVWWATDRGNRIGGGCTLYSHPPTDTAVHLLERAGWTRSNSDDSYTYRAGD